jgi:hypothetical protein
MKFVLGSFIRAARAHVEKKGAENRRLLDLQLTGYQAFTAANA